MGKRMRLSNGRKLVSDLLWMTKTIPAAGIGTEFSSPLVAQLRRRTKPRISWNVLYLKAYGAVAERTPELRQTFVRFPSGHLYEHDQAVCMLTISREHAGEERLFFARFVNPQHYALTELQARYDWLRRAPIEEIKQFRHQVRFANAPQWLRRLGWLTLCELFPRSRAKNMGAMGMSLSTYKGVDGYQHLGPMTTILGIDATPKKGLNRLTLTFDHRVMDGVPAARVLPRIQHVVDTSIREELASLVGANPETGKPLKRAG